MTQNENLIMQRGYNEKNLLYEIFLLFRQILGFTSWIKNTVVEFSKYVYLSFGILQIRVLIHEGQTPQGTARLLELQKLTLTKKQSVLQA